MGCGVPRIPSLRKKARPTEDQRVVDIFIALGASFVLAFVMTGPKVRRASEPRPATAAKPAKKKGT